MWKVMQRRVSTGFEFPAHYGSEPGCRAWVAANAGLYPGDAFEVVCADPSPVEEAERRRIEADRAFRRGWL